MTLYSQTLIDNPDCKINISSVEEVVKGAGTRRANYQEANEDLQREELHEKIFNPRLVLPLVCMIYVGQHFILRREPTPRIPELDSVVDL